MTDEVSHTKDILIDMTHSPRIGECIPSVEQINLEYRLSQSKASEAVQHAINCGLMLLQVKASLKHGEWLPWLKQQRETGQIDFSDETAKRYMRVASNRSRVTDLAPTSIRAALELLTEDKPAEPQPTLELETAKEREAREAAEAKAKAESEARAKAEQRAEDWREQAKAEKKKREEAETAARLKAEELKTLNQSIEQTAKRMAAAQLAEIKAELDNAKLDKIEAEHKIKALKKEQDAAAETKAKQIIQSQQDEINRREAQLRTIESRIETLNQRLIKVDQQDAVVAHFEQCTKEIRATLNTLGHQIQIAIDEEDAPFLPDPFVSTFKKLAEQLEQGGAGVRAFLANVEIRQLEVLTNG